MAEFSDTPIGEEHGECPYREGAEAMCSILNKADHGPMVIETWECAKCGLLMWEAHRFSEVVSCGKCGHRTASKVPRYRDMLNMLPDLRDKST